MNENRSVFALDGVTGMLIATVLLLGILAFLTVWNMSVQNANAENYYKWNSDIEKNIKANSTDNAKLAFQPVK
jgi:hypothetical protein